MAQHFPALRFLQSAARASDLPPCQSEVAFVGRSNVGKSSLLNAVTGHKQIARVSRTPGRTQLINVFDAGGDRWIVDLPGYGFAKVSRAERASWQRLVESYLDARRARLALLLQDVRRDWSEDESLLLAWLADRGIPAVVAITKFDKEKPMRAAARERALRAAIGLPPERVIATSATTGKGIDELWKAIHGEL